MNTITKIWKNNKAFRVTVIVLILTLNFIVIAYRYLNVKRISHDIYSGSQAERLETWNDMKRISLTDDNISQFIDKTLTSEILPLPQGVTQLSFNDLLKEQKNDIKQALEEFFKAYRTDNADIVYEYLAISRGSTTLHPEIRKSIEQIAKQENLLSHLNTEKAMFRYVWEKGSKGIGWESLLEKSGQYCLWQIDAPLKEEQALQMVLEDQNLFNNKSVMPHIFAVSLELLEHLSRKKKITFGDIFFVTELSKKKDNDFCAMSVRFWWNEKTQKWTPMMLALVTPQVRQDMQFPF
jgi:hypothetical protein